MAYPNHIYVAIGGRLGASEQWQTGFRLISDDYADAQEQIDRARDSLDDIEAHVATWWAAMDSELPASCHWDFLKVNAIGPDGRYLDQTTNAIYYAIDEAGHVGTATTGPFQLALCLSLQTAYTRGRASKGRMYLPLRSAPCDPATGQLTTVNADNIATHMATLFTSINDNPGLDVAHTRVAIVSEYGVFNDVTGVAAGKVPDTQRRRRAQLDENYGPTQPVTGQG